MLKTLSIALALLFSGCATNQLHFAPFTPSEVLARVRDAVPAAQISTISGLDVCSPCTEMSTIVWHAANYPYEGFSSIPISDWDGFIRNSLETRPGSSETPTVAIKINRIFLKTWQKPPYYACQVEVSVQTARTLRQGKGVIKLEGPGQQLIKRDLVSLDPTTLEAIRLALRLAYLNAMGG
jgi:hypothetical protein